MVYIYLIPQTSKSLENSPLNSDPLSVLTTGGAPNLDNISSKKNLAIKEELGCGIALASTHLL